MHQLPPWVFKTIIFVTLCVTSVSDGSATHQELGWNQPPDTAQSALQSRWKILNRKPMGTKDDRKDTMQVNTSAQS